MTFMADHSLRPNILLLMADEHRADVAGFAGDGVVRTPTLDWLAGSGVVFRNAYTPSPICIPGRQAVLSGQLPRTNGCERWAEDLPPHSMTFARRLAQYAYETVCAGKLHHFGPDQMQGWTVRLAPDMHTPPSSIAGRMDAEFARYARRDPKWKWSDLTEIERARVDDRSQNQRFDRHATEAACEFIEDYFVDLTYDRASPHRPLLLKVSLLQPHYPYITTAERMAYYFNRVTPFLCEPEFEHRVLNRRRVRPGVDATERELRRATAAYYGMIEAVDAHFGQVLRMLEHVGQDLDEWIIIYTSDHGEMLGEHGIWEKTTFYEGSVRVPLVIRWPRRYAPRTVQENVNLCDLFATLCEVTGVPAPPGLDSRSLAPLMNGQTDEWHRRHRNETVSQFDGRHLMIKWDDLKYQWYGEDAEEVLFDLKRDPRETKNVIARPEHASVLERLRMRRRQLGFPASNAYQNASYLG
jgi:choline-sulfatase